MRISSDAIDDAVRKRVLVFAAVGNDGNRYETAFPAKLEGSVVRVFSANGKVKASAAFNPPASASSIMNFGFLGEKVAVRTARGVETRAEGTSISTSIAAATAALLIDFSQRQDCAHLLRREKLKTVRGMSAVMAKMSTIEGQFYCFNPWSGWLAPRDDVAPSDSLKRRYIWDTINREL
jgi:hypothetical protein